MKATEGTILMKTLAKLKYPTIKLEGKVEKCVLKRH